MEVKMIDIKDIVTNPLQPRQTFDREKLQELADSIKEGELLQPIVVRVKDKKFEIVCGERRYKAFQILKEPKIPAIVRVIKDDTDALEKSTIENWQRADLTDTEKRKAITDLWKSKRYKSMEDLSRKTGIGIHSIKAYIEENEFRLRVDDLPEDVSHTDIRATEGLDDDVRKKVIEIASDKNIPARKLEEEIVPKLKEFSETEQQMEILEDFEEQEEQTRETFDRIIQQKKEIADGEREPEHIIQVETNTDQRLIDSYKQIKNNVFEIYHDHILHIKSDAKRKEAIKILWDIYNFLDKELKALGEIKVVE